MPIRLNGNQPLSVTDPVFWTVCHEAGHIIAAIELNLPFEYAVICKGHANPYGVTQIDKSIPITVEQNLKMLLSGAGGELRVYLDLYQNRYPKKDMINATLDRSRGDIADFMKFGHNISGGASIDQFLKFSIGEITNRLIANNTDLFYSTINYLVSSNFCSKDCFQKLRSGTSPRKLSVAEKMSIMHRDHALYYVE